MVSKFSAQPKKKNLQKCLNTPSDHKRSTYISN